MRLQLLALATLPLLLCCGSDSNTTAPTAPSTPATTPSAPSTTPAAPGANRAPTVAIQAVTPRIALVGGSNVQFSATGSDPDGDPLTFTWDFGDDQTAVGEGAGHVYDSEGTFRVILTVRDGRGGQVTAEETVTSRKLTGTWRMEDARHSILLARLNQNNGHAVSGNVNGTYSGELNGSTGDGTVNFRFTSGSQYCVATGTYRGTVDAGINTIDFAGPGCRGFSLHRE